jgi:CRISPR-associated protein Csm4
MLYCYRITPQSAWGTPMRSDTLYGHLLCAAGEKYGLEKLQELLERFKQGDAPFVLSSAMPADCLPVPVLPPIGRPRFKELAKSHFEDLFDALSTQKAFKKKQYISVDTWLRLQEDFSSEKLLLDFKHQQASVKAGSAEKKPASENRQVLHNSINRLSNRVQSEGGLYSESATFYHNSCFDLYVQTQDIEQFDDLFKHLEQTGFGRDRSTGRGFFTRERKDDFPAKPLFAAKGNADMTLSVFAHQQLDQIQGWYRLFTKQGKVWNGFGESNPFKKPFLAFQEGSVFKQIPRTPAILSNIHSNPDYIQIAQPLTLPLNVKEVSA